MTTNNSMSNQKVHSRVCIVKSRSILHNVHTPVISKMFVLAHTHKGLTLTMLFSYISKRRHEINVIHLNRKVAENMNFQVTFSTIFICYCVILIFATFESEGRLSI